MNVFPEIREQMVAAAARAIDTQHPPVLHGRGRGFARTGWFRCSRRLARWRSVSLRSCRCITAQPRLVLAAPRLGSARSRRSLRFCAARRLPPIASRTESRDVSP